MTLPTRQYQLRMVDQDAFRDLRQSKVPSLAAQVLAARGITDISELFGTDKLPAIAENSRAAQAAAVIAEAIKAKKRIFVVSDFDCDGICSAVIAHEALNRLNAKSSIHFCQRGKERGLSVERVEQAYEEGYGLIITADNGITSYDAASKAAIREIGLVITDHHTPGQTLPVDAAVANPHLDDSGLPTKHMCGAAVLLLVFREVVRCLGERVHLADLRDLAAVATIADVVPMTDSFNRQLVHEGMDLIRQKRCRAAFKVILGETRVHACTTHDISFRIVPLLNAPGRFGRPDRSYSFLQADNMSDAYSSAREIEGYNRERKKQASMILAEAQEMLQGTDSAVNIAANYSWPDGMLGLTAGRLMSETGKPSIIISLTESSIRGSIRCPGGYSAVKIMRTINERVPNLLEEFGGHDSAAGFSSSGNLEAIKQELNREFTQASLNLDSKSKVLMIDATPSYSDLCDGSIEFLSGVAWGNQFRQPLFNGRFEIIRVNQAASGRGFQHKLELDGKPVSAWHTTQLGKSGTQVAIAYHTAYPPRRNSPPMLFPRCLL